MNESAKEQCSDGRERSRRGRIPGGPQPERTSEEHDKQALLLKLAERTVLQAEALAQEITNRAREQSEA